MKPGERIRLFRKNRGLKQVQCANQLGISQGFLAQIEKGIRDPSREFLIKMKDVFGIPSDYILYGIREQELQKIKEVLILEEVGPDVAIKIEESFLSVLAAASQSEYYRGYTEGSRVSDVEAEYQMLSTATKKILDDVVEILGSENEVMITALRHNIKAFLEAVRTGKKLPNKPEGVFGPKREG